ncbi:MAG: hypothetical protein R3Y05_01060 [bacterium]
MKKFIALIGLAIASISLTGCELNYSFGTEGGGVSSGINSVQEFIDYLNGDSGNCEMKIDMSFLVIEAKIDGDIMWMEMKMMNLDPETGAPVLDAEGNPTFITMESYVEDHGDGTMTTYTKDLENDTWSKETGPYSDSDSGMGDLDMSTLKAEDFEKQEDGSYTMVDSEGMTHKMTLGSDAKYSSGMEFEGEFFEMMSIFNINKVSLTLPTATEATA